MALLGTKAVTVDDVTALPLARWESLIMSTGLEEMMARPPAVLAQEAFHLEIVYG